MARGDGHVKVLVAGAGAVGLWLAARLQARHEVTALCRPAHAHAIARDGLHITGHTSFAGPVPCITAPAGDYDVAIITCKAMDTAAMATAVADRCAVLASMQNGLGNAAKLEATEHGALALALTSHGLKVEGPGQVRHAGKGTIRVGPHGHESPARVVATLLSDAGLDPVWTPDMEGAVWEKAIVNAGINPVAALHDVPNGGLLAPQLMSLCRALVDEAYALSRAAGVHVVDPWTTTRGVIETTADNVCSMLQDVRAGRPTEIEQITGHMVRLARRLGYPMPVSEDVYRRIKALEASYLGDEGAAATTRREVGA